MPSMEPTLERKNSKRIIVVLAVLGVVAIVVGVTVAWVLAAMQKQDVRSALEQVVRQADVGYPLFYPAQLPDGFSLSQEDQVAVMEGGVNFVLVGGGKKIYVTQQPRPRLMEEVVKTQEFTTSAGQGYTADLNGRVAGFLVTPETLVIATSPEQVDPAVLRKMIESLVPVQ